MLGSDGKIGADSHALKKLTMSALAGSATYPRSTVMRMRRLSVVYLFQLLLFTVALSSCSSSTTGVADRQTKPGTGFFERLGTN